MTTAMWTKNAKNLNHNDYMLNCRDIFPCQCYAISLSSNAYRSNAVHRNILSPQHALKTCMYASVVSILFFYYRLQVVLEVSLAL